MTTAVPGAVARVALPAGGTVRISLPETARFRVARGPYFPEFGRCMERAVLLGEAQDLARADWRIDS